MARGPKKHLKKINTPRSWLLAKMDGIYATRPSQGPHKLRECLPLSIIMRNRLRLALNNREVKMIVMDKDGGIRIDNKIRRDPKFPVGCMDVIHVVKTGENFRLLFDVKGRFILVKIKDSEARYKLLKIKTKAIGPNKVPYIVTNDARTIRYPHPDINQGDTIKYDLENNKIQSWYRNEPGHLAYITGGNNIGRVGTIMHIERHLGSFDIAHLKDSNGKTFCTRNGNVFIIGDKKPELTLPAGDGKYLSIQEQKLAKEERVRKTSK